MKKILFSLLLFAIVVPAFGGRRVIGLNDNWMFRLATQVNYKTEKRVELPHTWNAADALAGDANYFRGTGYYTKQLQVPADWKGKRLFLRFEGANTVTDLFINGFFIGEHRGGYGAFVFEITDKVKYGANNNLKVAVSNALESDVMPLVGDFNMYGGIYRDVNLIITEPVNISLTDYASPGVYLIQKKVSREVADVTAKVVVSNGSAKETEITADVQVFDGQKQVLDQSSAQTVAAGQQAFVEVPLSLVKPHLWNARKDPFMYRAVITLKANGSVIDTVEQPLGLRFFSVDADKGFFLNGEHLALHGVCRHQERAVVGNALRPEHHEEDAAIMAEMGVNAVRLSHYPQADYFYTLLDKYGIVAWSEIPFVGPGGYQDVGYINQPSFRENGKQQLRELIRQHYNHPSICFWGLFNELKTEGDDPTEYIKELNEIAHTEDPTRPTTAASFLETSNPIGQVTDLIAWNKYYGWYGGSATQFGAFLDKTHKDYPQYKIAISEYGAGASIYHQQDSVKQGPATGTWHPENYQTYFHMENWKALSQRPYVWGSFVWAMFDFGSAFRTEGDRFGFNDKGLVTQDRKVKKDAFYFYKANWNKEEPFVYISNRRNTVRQNDRTDVMVFSNLSEAELFVNGKSLGIAKPDNYATLVWKSVQLSKGENKIEVRAKSNNGVRKSNVSDSVVWVLR